MGISFLASANNKQMDALSVNNIFFIGLMGAGKTTIGRLVSKKTGKQFFDSDHEIEQKTGVRIPLIFELEGEAGFRKRESAMIQHLCALDNIVLATGGGAILREENRTYLKNNGTVIYLRGQPQDLWQRTRHDKSRPLLQGGDMQQKLNKLYAERDPIYQALADHVVPTGSQTSLEITETIIKIINRQQNNQPN